MWSGDLIHFYNLLLYMFENKMFSIEIIINIIIGPLCSNKKKIKLLTNKSSNIIIHENINNLNIILARTDLLISSSGMISNEANYFGVPGIYFQVSKNQIIDNQYLEKIGMYFNKNINHLKNKKKLSKLLSLVVSNIKSVKKFTASIKIDL